MEVPVWSSDPEQDFSPNSLILNIGSTVVHLVSYTLVLSHTTQPGSPSILALMPLEIPILS